MKRIGECIEVTTRGGWPVAFRRGGRLRRVRAVVEVWIVQGRWWSDEARRVYFRVDTGAGTYDLYQEHDRWYLAGIVD